MGSIQPLGPAGVAARMQQIEAQLSALSGRTDVPAPIVDGPTGGVGGSFSSALQNSQIGTNPLDAFGNGNSLTATGPSDQLKGMIESAALDHNLDPKLLDALVQVESSYNPGARSHVGAAGLTQLMPNTARDLGVTNPFDPAQNLQGGAKYLAQMLAQFGDLPRALAAYNAGPSAVVKHGGVPPFKETNAYVEKIMKIYAGGDVR